MGFLEIFGKALEWEESKKYHEKIRENAIEVLIQWIKSVQHKKSKPKFGYEVIKIPNNKRKIFFTFNLLINLFTF